jgi:ankyrin repeat protein
MTPFHSASKKGHFDACKLLIKNVKDKNPTALDGCTLLLLATKDGHLEIVRLMG